MYFLSTIYHFRFNFKLRLLFSILLYYTQVGINILWCFRLQNALWIVSTYYLLYLIKDIKKAIIQMHPSFFIWLLSSWWWYGKICWKTKSTKKDGKINQKFNFSTMELHAKVGTFLLTMKKEERERERAQNSQKPSIVWMIKFSLHFEQFFLFSFSIKKSPPKTHSEIGVKSKFIIVNGVKNL